MAGFIDSDPVFTYVCRRLIYQVSDCKKKTIALPRIDGSNIDFLPISMYEVAFAFSSGKTSATKDHQVKRYYMFKNSFKTAFRTLIRNWNYAILNITGLASGIAMCLLIFIVIQFQTSYDNFHLNKDRIYRVLTEYQGDAGTISYSKDLPFPMAIGLKTAFPQLEQVAPVWESQNDQLLVLDANGKPLKTFKEQHGVFFAEPSFFKLFNFPLLTGSYESLKDPDNVLLTKEVAEKYFGDWKTAMGKTLNLEVGGHIFEHGSDRVKVSGILATIPPNTDFQIKMVVAFGTGITGYLAGSTDWNDRTNSNFGCYLMMPPDMSIENFNQQLRAYSKKMKSDDNKDSHIVQSLNKVHYDSETGNYSNKTISVELLKVFWLVAAFILLIACVNFVNLSTVQAVNRAKEVGVRKVLGSTKIQLQVQFIIETSLIVTAAVLLATVFAFLALPFINQLLELSLSFNIIKNPSILMFLLVITFVVIALAGIYPSIVLSGFNPVKALKSKVDANAARGISLRRTLVVFQFVIAQALIIGTFIIVNQMDYFMNKPLGFNKDAIINVPFRVDSLRISRLDFLRNRLMSVNGVQEVSFSSNTPVEDGNDLWSTFKYNRAVKDADFKVITKFADPSFIPAYQLTIIAGRNLQPAGMTREFLVNESLMKRLGINNPDEILNKELSIWNGMIKCPVVGVIKDFNDRPFRHEIAPLIMTTNSTMYNLASVKIGTTNLSSTLQSVKKNFEEAFPNFVYEYRFFDDKLEGFYKQENQLAELHKIFAGLAIFLSCLGLYGLASFMAVQRKKEVGIRKVLGATPGNIVYMFSKEFALLIVIAFSIAAPIVRYYMHQWLQNYVYRISLSWWPFVGGGLGAMVIALATISYQAVKAALTSPVKSIRAD